MVEIIDTSGIVPISPLTPRALRRAIAEEVAADYEIDPALIESDSRSEEVVEARAIVARRLHALGMSEQRVADVMHIKLRRARTYLGMLATRRLGRLGHFSAIDKQETNDARNC